MDVHKDERGLAHVDACGQGGEGVKNPIFCERHKWMAPRLNTQPRPTRY